MSLKRNLTYNFILSLSQVAFPLLSIPYISRVLDPTGIGKVSFIDSLTYYFIVIAEFGIASYGIREVSRQRMQPEALKKTVSELLSLHLVISLVSIVLYAAFIAIMYHKINDIRLVLFSVTFLLVNAFACEWYFWGTEQFKYIALRTMFARGLGLISIFLLINQPKDYYIYYGIITISALVNLLWNAYRLVREIKIKFSGLNWRRHIVSLKINYLISLNYSVVLMLDNVFLQMVSTSAAVAFYALSAKVARISGNLITDTMLVFYPRTVALVHNKEQSSIQTTINYSANLIILTAIPMGFGMFLLSGTFTEIYFGDAFGPIAINLKILSLYPFLRAFGLLLSKQFLLPYDLEKTVLKCSLAGTICFIVCTIPLSYYFNDKGTSMAVILSEITVVTYCWYYVKKIDIGLKIAQFRSFGEAICGSLLFIPIIYVIGPMFNNPLFSLITEVILCVSVYFFFLLLIMKNELLITLFENFNYKVKS